MNKIETYDESGKFVKGLFYELTIPMYSDLDLPEMRHCASAVVNVPRVDSAIEYWHAESVMNSRKLQQCPLDPTHVTAYRIDDVEVDLYYGGKTRGFIPDINSTILLVDRRLKTAMESSGLRGYAIAPAKVRVNQAAKEVAPEIFWLQVVAKNCVRKPIVHVPSSNACFKCGWSPIVCPACHAMAPGDCPKCKTGLYVPAQRWKSDDDPRFVVGPSNNNGGIIEAAQWDGNDFTGGPNAWDHVYVTRRTVDFLMKVKAIPFVAQSRRANVEGMSPQEIKDLHRRAVG